MLLSKPQNILLPTHFEMKTTSQCLNSKCVKTCVLFEVMKTIDMVQMTAVRYRVRQINKNVVCTFLIRHPQIIDRI